MEADTREPLGRDAEAKEELVAMLAEEFLERLRAGEALGIETYVAAHPEGAPELGELLPAMVDMEGLVHTSLPPAPAWAHYPERLGDYRLLERIGSGGMGTVFRALQESLHREVAVKILAPSWNADARHSEAFENESRVIAGLRHTNIVEVYGAGQEGDYRYYVMGLVNGQGVSAGRLAAAFPGVSYEKAVAKVGVQAARALAFAHRHGVVHRDVKPGNLLLDANGVLHVSDFGLATVLNSGEDAPLVTQSHDGTLRYMAPERLMKGINSFAGDQYGLGLTLYELMVRRPVFRETAPGKLVHSICSCALEPLRGAGELGAIINKAISFDPADRYAAMDDMAADLQRYLEGKPVKARPATLLRRYVLWMRRRPAVAIWSHVAAVMVVALMVTISIAYARERASLKSENEQRRRAELNAQIADASLQRIFSSMVYHGEGDEDFLPPSRADARLIQDLMPYYEQLVAHAGNGGAKVIEAASILAAIALQTGDYATAETYFRRVAEAAPEGSLAQAEATNGLATAIYSQSDISRYEEANRLLLAQAAQPQEGVSYDTRLERVRGLLLAARHLEWRPPGKPPGKAGQDGKAGRQSHSRSSRLRMNRALAAQGGEPAYGKQRGGLNRRAARLLRALLDEQPGNEKARLLQAELLQFSRGGEVKRLLAPNGETALSVLEELLKEQPQSDVFQRAYLRLVIAPPFPGTERQTVDWQQAAQYAQNLLAFNPGDSESIMLFLTVRDRYAEALARGGKADEATRENERTLGVLSFLTSRADFTPEIREKLVMLVAMHPRHDEARTQQAEELRTLLQNYDEQRIKALQKRMQRMREEMPRLRPLRHGNGHPARRHPPAQAPQAGNHRAEGSCLAPKVRA